MRTSESIDLLATALSLAQGEFAVPVKSKDNPYFKTKYADLDEVIKATKPALNKYGLAVLQFPSTNESRFVCLTTRLAHKSGQWIEGDLVIKPAKDDAQSVGSAITYARRYSLSAILGIASEPDDDGNHATGNLNKKEQPYKREPHYEEIPFEAQPKQKVVRPEPRIFFKADAKLAEWLDKQLTLKKLSQEAKYAITEEMEGKDINKDLLPLLNAFKKQEEGLLGD